jgi:ADP-L-glycero-D-manno-heptose 6-epimerase
MVNSREREAIQSRGREGAIVVTGATGFIGRRVVRRLAPDARRPFVAVDLHAHDFSNADPRVCLKVGDIAQPAMLHELQSLAPTVIVHLASVTNSMIWDRNFMLDRNVGDFDRILSLAESVGARVVFASSAAVYGNGPVPMRETQEPQPHNPYALSKLLMEQRAEKARQRGLSVLALRFFNVYGPGEAHKNASASMVFQVHQALTRGEAARVFRNGEHRRDFVHVDDVSAAIATAVDSDAEGIVNVGSGEATTFNELIAVIAETTGTAPRVEYIDEPTWEYQRQTWASLEHASECLGFRPRSLTEGIRDFVAEVNLNRISEM